MHMFHLDHTIRPSLGKFVALEGENFSGRTDILRMLTGIEVETAAARVTRNQNEQAFAYIGPEVYNAISGLATTVYGELCLHAGGPAEQAVIAPLVADLPLATLASRNPFTLSGGEQVMLTVTSALALCPAILGIDCVLEQLDSAFKARLLRWLRRGVCDDTTTVVADNRLDECGRFTAILEAGLFERRVPTNRLDLQPVCAAATFPFTSSRSRRLTLDGVSFAYQRGATVLRDISMDLAPGLYFLQGPNGAGKSTLAKMLSGVLKPQRGRVLVDEVEYRPWKQPGQLVAYHFQNPDLQLFSTSVEAEVKAGPRARGLPETECTNRAASIIRIFGLEGILREHPLDLPFAVRKRVALAATLAMGAPWVILDEPTLGQDRTASEEIAKLILALCDTGVGVIVISHWQALQQRLRGSCLDIDSGHLTRRAHGDGDGL